MTAPREHQPASGHRSVPDGGSVPAHEHHHESGVLAAAVRVVGFLTLLSRFVGLARDIVTARIFGDGPLASAFRAAYALPNLFRRLFGEGALSAAFLPQYTLLNRDDPALADELASLTLRLLTLATGVLTLVGMGVLALLLLVLPADPERTTSFRLMILMLPMMPAVCMTAILGGMLQANGRFAIPSAAPVLLNLAQIGAGAAYFFGWVTDKSLMAYIVGVAALLASVAQVAWSFAGLRGKVRWRRAGALAREHARTVWDRFVPAMLGLGTLQVNTMMDMVIAMWPVWIGTTILGYEVPLDDRSNGILSYTQTMYQFPLGVFGIAVATAIFPLLSRNADRPDAFAATLRRGLRLSLYIGLPASLGLILVRHELIGVIFGGRSGFSAKGLACSADVLMGFAPAVWAYSLNHVLTRAFYAQGNTRTPMRLAVAMVGLNFLLNITLIWPLREAGLAWSTATSATVQCLVLWRLSRKQMGREPLDRETVIAFAKIVLACGVMGACVWGVLHWIPASVTWRGCLVRLCAGVGTGGGVYTIVSLVGGLPELRWLFQRAPSNANGAAPIIGME